MGQQQEGKVDQESFVFQVEAITAYWYTKDKYPVEGEKMMKQEKEKNNFLMLSEGRICPQLKT